MLGSDRYVLYLKLFPDNNKKHLLFSQQLRFWCNLEVCALLLS